jgi:hypothetical protein
VAGAFAVGAAGAFSAGGVGAFSVGVGCAGAGVCAGRGVAVCACAWALTLKITSEAAVESHIRFRFESPDIVFGPDKVRGFAIINELGKRTCRRHATD